MKKKYLLLTIISLLVVMMAACSGKNPSSNGTGQDKGSVADVSVKLDILSWWTAGGEAEALNAVLKGFTEQNPLIKVENAAIAGGAGANSQAVLSTRLQGGDPPAVFQAQGGPDLLRWQDAGYLQPLNDLYEVNGWNEVFPPALIEMNSKEGQIYGLPINVHRNNVIWYNKKVFADHSIEPPATFEDFFAIAEKLKSNGIVPLALGDKTSRWATLVFEMALLDEFGVDGAADLWTGNVDFDSPQMRSTLETFSKILDFTNENHSALDWQDAAELVISGQAAMHIMGDWETGFFESKNFKLDVDYGWVQAPNSEKVFSIVNDSLGMPKGVVNVEEAKKFITYLGSEQAQKDFNTLKGSVPARTDVDLSSFNPYSQGAAKDFKEAKINISLAGGSATPAGFINKVDDTVKEFVTQRNIDNFIKSLNQAKSLLNP
ncbi:extracellular solute-binding protein [Paenibacillus sp. GXUN7292]|uniref:ABC transporter substrate-binding protein n=1 Tax=Paenibacillus sp. GXUN7292 TaxID=3422499 RepID=UPI003D7C5BEF